MKSETTGFIRHAHVMLTQAFERIKEEWEDQEVTLSPAQASEMRRETEEVKKLVEAVDVYVREFEKVAAARVPQKI